MLCLVPAFPSHSHANHHRGFRCGATRPPPLLRRHLAGLTVIAEEALPAAQNSGKPDAHWGNAGKGTTISSADLAYRGLQAAHGGHRQAGLLRWQRTTRRVRQGGPLLYRSPPLPSSAAFAQFAPARMRIHRERICQYAERRPDKRSLLGGKQARYERFAQVGTFGRKSAKRQATRGDRTLKEAADELGGSLNGLRPSSSNSVSFRGPSETEMHIRLILRWSGCFCTSQPAKAFTSIPPAEGSTGSRRNHRPGCSSRAS